MNNKTILTVLAVVVSIVVLYFVFIKKKPSTVAQAAKAAPGDKLKNYIESKLTAEQLQKFREWVIGFEQEQLTQTDRAKDWLQGWENDSKALKIPLESARDRNILWLMHDTDGILTKSEWDQMNTDIVFLYR